MRHQIITDYQAYKQLSLINLSTVMFLDGNQRTQRKPMWTKAKLYTDSNLSFLIVVP